MKRIFKLRLSDFRLSTSCNRRPIIEICSVIVFLFATHVNMHAQVDWKLDGNSVTTDSKL